jgi:hypothetical protein
MSNVISNPKRNVTQKVLVIYETVAAREQVARALEESRPSGSAENVMHWRSCSRLNERPFAEEAAEHAKTADMIIFTGPAENEFPAELKLWIERWLSKRDEREGAIVGIFPARSTRRAETGTQKEIYLRHIALRAGMDYLCHVPRCGCKAMPESLDVYNQRAGQMTSVLYDILRNSQAATFPGLSLIDRPPNPSSR